MEAAPLRISTAWSDDFRAALWTAEGAGAEIVAAGGAKEGIGLLLSEEQRPVVALALDVPDHRRNDDREQVERDNEDSLKEIALLR